MSALIVFVIFLGVYLSGRTKIPLSYKYFKFRPYILVEIFKVALPNFVDSSLWCFSASFINSVLLMTTGEMGPILYSAANKLKGLLISPIRAYGRALMSVTGHLFGAHEFGDLRSMFNYALKVSFASMLVLMIIFVFVRNYAFAVFSITGMENEVFWIAIGGVIIMTSIPFSMISSKMLDGFGKSIYSLFITFIKILFETLLIYGLSLYISDGSCVLIAIIISEVLFGIIYYLFLRYLFDHFDERYGDKATVQTFNDDKLLTDHDAKDENVSKFKQIKSKLPLIIALIAFIVLFLEIALLPIRSKSYSMMMIAMFAFVIGWISIYLMEKLNKPLLSLAGFLLNAVLIFVFMGNHGYISTVLFILAGAAIIYIKLIIGKLKHPNDSN